MLKIAANDLTGLRRFGWQMALAVALCFGLLIPWLFNLTLPLWPWYLAGALLILALASPRLLYWPSRLWLILAAAIGWLNTRLILALVFYLLVTPLGIVLRILGKLDYKVTSSGHSFWRDAGPERDNDMKDPF
uniref:SxtJ n=1 Tax=Rheinheimera sp. BAL341 TaxID=1708203 RepID=A0A486XU46_9GAMM